MADGVFNIAKGRVAYYASLPETSDALIIVLLKDTAEADGTLEDHTNLASVLASNSEADFTNYVRKTASGVTANVDTTNDRVDCDFDDLLWTDAGGATNNDLVKLLVCYDENTGSGTDTNIIPLCHYDYVITTDGSDLTAQVNSAGFFRAS